MPSLDLPHQNHQTQTFHPVSLPVRLSKSPKNMGFRIVAYKAHILVLLFIIATAWTGHHDHGLKFSLMQGFQMALRFCVSLCFFDPWVSIPFNFIYFVADMFIYLFVVDQENSSMPRMGFIFCSQVFILVPLD